MITTRKARILFLLTTSIFGLVVATACGSETERNVGADSMTDDGRRAVIVEHSGDPLTWRLLSLDLDSGDVVTLAADVHNPPSSSFSPDGRHVLFRSTEGWMMMEATGGETVQVADSDKEVSFLPDGTLLLSSGDGDLNEYHTLNPDRLQFGDPELLLGDVQHIFKPSTTGCLQSRSGDTFPWVAVSKSDTVFTLEVSQDGITTRTLAPKLSGGLRDLLDRQDILIGEMLDLIVEQLVSSGLYESSESAREAVNMELPEVLEKASPVGIVSPDGTKLLWRRLEFAVSKEDALKLLTNAEIDEDQELEIEGIDHFLYLIDLVSGAEPRILSSETTWQPGAAFSPDGKQILFESNRDGGRALYLGATDGTAAPRRLVTLLETDDQPVRTHYFGFSPDGRQILFESNHEGEWALYLASAEGSNILRITDQPVVEPCWHFQSADTAKTLQGSN